MSERTGYPQGTPSWADLATSDPEGARQFYGGLFGWDFDVNPDPQFGGYAQALLRGKTVAGVGAQQDPAAPAAWTTYLAADDVDKVAEAVPQQGGTLAMPPMSVGEEGRMAVATDPTGAFFGLWQSGRHTGAELVNGPGTMVWHELATPDLDRATAFYSAIVGVGWSDMDTGGSGMVYKLLQVDGRTAGGAMQQQPDSGQPPYWLVYFEVADANAAASRVTELGGRVIDGPIDTPQGPMLVASDPQGAVFAL